MAFMKKSKSLVSFCSLVMMMMALVVLQNQVAVKGQAPDTCSAGLASLNVCTPFVMAGAGGTAPPPPSPECCGALQGVNPDCLCSTIRVASRLPTLCNIPPRPCPAY